MTIALTILEQLGGNKFKVMTGAKDFVSHGTSLTFRLPAKFAKNKSNYVTITLTPDDLYRMEFCFYRAMNLRTISKHEGLYADMLQSVFTEQTGLDTHL